MPLVDHLIAQEAESLTLFLAQIEVIVGFALPGAAYGEHSFWAHAPTALVRILTDAGWKARLRTHERAVVFTRATVPPRM